MSQNIHYPKKQDNEVNCITEQFKEMKLTYTLLANRMDTLETVHRQLVKRTQFLDDRIVELQQKVGVNESTTD